LIRKLVTAKISSGQLDNAPLTLYEIDQIEASFADTLQGVFHPRISYPSDSSSAEQDQQSQSGAPEAPAQTDASPQEDDAPTGQEPPSVETETKEDTSIDPEPSPQGVPVDGGRPDPTAV
jgi:hypothetical protein